MEYWSPPAGKAAPRCISRNPGIPVPAPKSGLQLQCPGIHIALSVRVSGKACWLFALYILSPRIDGVLIHSG